VNTAPVVIPSRPSTIGVEIPGSRYEPNRRALERGTVAVKRSHPFQEEATRLICRLPMVGRTTSAPYSYFAGRPIARPAGNGECNVASKNELTCGRLQNNGARLPSFRRSNDSWPFRLHVELDLHFFSRCSDLDGFDFSTQHRVCSGS
jgi:hypothetical protein